MEYPKNFVDRAKRIYPNWAKLHELLDKGSPFVGTLLRDAQPSGSISIVRVLNAETLEELQEYAKSELEKTELYAQWTVLVEQYQKEHNAKVLAAIEHAHQRGERLT